MGVMIHSEAGIGWHQPFAHRMREGLKALGINAGITSSRVRETDIAILLGTTLWRGIEASGRYLLVDRCSLGNEKTWVSLVWDGHGRRGNHCVPEQISAARWQMLALDIVPWRGGSRTVLCGQISPYSPHWQNLPDWYASVPATHFRRHPRGENPTGLPEASDFCNTKVAVTLNSSVGVNAVLFGVPTVTMDEGAMAWDVTGHTPDEIVKPDREPWLHWLAWTQWHMDEIESGHPIAHLFEDI